MTRGHPPGGRGARPALAAGAALGAAALLEGAWTADALPLGGGPAPLAVAGGLLAGGLLAAAGASTALRARASGALAVGGLLTSAAAGAAVLAPALGPWVPREAASAGPALLALAAGLVCPAGRGPRAAAGPGGPLARARDDVPGQARAAGDLDARDAAPTDTAATSCAPAPTNVGDATGDDAAGSASRPRARAGPGAQAGGRASAQLVTALVAGAALAAWALARAGLGQGDARGPSATGDAGRVLPLLAGLGVAAATLAFAALRARPRDAAARGRPRGRPAARALGAGPTIEPAGPPPGRVASEAARPGAALVLALLVGARLGALGAGLTWLLGHAAPAAPGRVGAAVALGAAAGAAALGARAPSGRPPRRGALLAVEAAAWPAAAWLLALGVDLLAWPRAALLAAGALALPGGALVARTAAAAPALVVGAGLLAAGLAAAPTARLLARSLAPADRAALALGLGAPAEGGPAPGSPGVEAPAGPARPAGAPRGDVDRAAVAAALARGALEVRFDAPAPTPVVVLDTRGAGARGEPTGARLLSVWGQTVAAAPLKRDAEPRLVAAATLEGALPALLAPTPPGRVAVLGLDAGVAAGVAASAPGLEHLVVVEERAGVVAAHRDPGDLFGAVAGRPLEDPRVRLVEGSRTAWLRRQAPGAWEAVLAGPLDARTPWGLVARVCPGPVVARVEPPPAGAQAADGSGARARAGPWGLRAALAALGGAPAWALWPREDGPVLLVVGADLAPDRVASRLAARAGAAGEGLATSLARVGIDGAEQLVGLALAGPRGVAAWLADASGPDDPVALAVRSADLLPDDLALPADPPARAGWLARLAQDAGRRRAPATLPLARAALAAARTVESLQVLGDALAQDGRPDDALALWREARALDPTALGPRAAEASLLAARGEAAAARGLLEGALTGDAGRDAPARYLLGRLAQARGDWAEALAAYKAAGAFRDADDQAALAREMLRRAGDDAATPGRPGPAQRLALARALLDRSARADPAQAARMRDDAVAALGSATAALDLDDATRREAARLYELVARAHAPPSRGRPAAQAPSASPDALAQATALRARAAGLLAPVREPAARLERARLLAAAGDQGEALRQLEALAREDGARLPRVHVALGDLHAEAGRADAAIRAYEQALALAPGSSADAKVYLALAALHREAGRRERAVAALEDAERAAPGHPEVRANLGTLYLELGRDGDALRTWRLYLEVAPPRDPLRARVEAAVQRLEARR